MSPVVRPRGPLPARVYWTRRLVVLALPLVLVLTLARVLGGGSGDDEEGATATQASARTTRAPQAESLGPQVPPTREKAGRGKKGKAGKNGKKQAPPKPVLAEPSGPCADSDILVAPAVTEVPGGSDAAITLILRTVEAEACTWQVSPETLTVSITSGKDDIWSSRECPAAIPAQEVVVRRDVDTPVTFTWHTRRSDETCSRLTQWARPGWYHVQAAALGGEPTDVQFELVRPSRPVVTRTVTPEPEGRNKKRGKDKDRAHTPGEDGAGNSDG